MENFNAKDYLNKMLSDKQRAIQIIAIFAIEKRYTFDNMEQLQWFIKRNAKAAKRLECFTNEKIKQTLKYLLETQEYKVGLETVEKFVMENVKKLDGEKPIVTLNNGEEIYDTTKLLELERAGRITYNERTKKWAEVS